MANKEQLIRELHSTCRACMRKIKPGNFLSLAKDSVREVFVKCTDIYISKLDKLSLKICKDCLEKCADFVNFKAKCNKNDDLMRNLFENSGAKQEMITLGLDGPTPWKVAALKTAPNDPLIDDEEMLDNFEELIDESSQPDFDLMDLDTEEYLEEDSSVEVPTNEPQKKVDGIENSVVATNETMDKIEIICPICSKSLVGYLSYQSHVLIHKVSTEKWDCSLCGKFNPNIVTYQHHMHSHTNVRYNCTTCTKTFNAPRLLKKHLRERHSVIIRKKPANIEGLLESVDGDLKCPVCSKMCNKTNLAPHIYQHICRETKQCPICHRPFMRVDIVRAHILVHLNMKLKCEQCSNEYSNRRSLRAHVLRDHGGKGMPKAPPAGPHFCEFCGKKFQFQSLLQTHLLVEHADQEQHHKCYVCKEVFEDFPSLKAHLDTHNKYKPYTCNICNEPVMKNLVTRHIMEAHTDGKQCKVCNKSIDNRSHLTVHMQKHNEVPNICKVCGVRCLSAEALKEHQTTHEGSAFVCYVCGKSLKSNRNLVRHVRSFH